MSNKNIALTLKQYVVKQMSFALNDEFIPGPDQIDLHPDFRRTINRLDADTASIILTFEIKKERDLPFSMKIEVEGIFSLNAWAEDKIKSLIMSNNTVAILFPYLRALITLLTANANIPPYILPVMNINELLREAEKTISPAN